METPTFGRIELELVKQREWPPAFPTNQLGQVGSLQILQKLQDLIVACEFEPLDQCEPVLLGFGTETSEKLS
jgi:hypothetical protein